MNKRIQKIRLFVFLLAGVLITSFTMNFLQQPQQDVTEAIQQGNVSRLSKHFNASLDLTLPGIENTFSKAQAEVMMKEFFAKNPPQSFKVNHQGSSKDGSQYVIGTYTSTNGKHFRTYFLFKRSGTGMLINQLQFEVD